jgi:hypothetical protein
VNVGEVFGFLAGGTSGTYGLYRYTASESRELLVQESELLADKGSELAEEAGIEKAEISETDLLSICTAKGFNPELFWSPDREVLLVELAEPYSTLRATADPVSKTLHKRPWWAFWR